MQLRRSVAAMAEQFIQIMQERIEYMALITDNTVAERLGPKQCKIGAEADNTVAERLGP